MSGSRSASRMARRPRSRLAKQTLERNSRSRSRPHPSPSPDRVRERPALPQGPAAPFLGGCDSADPLQALRVLLRALHIDIGAAADHLDKFLIERANRARRRADDQRIVRETLAFGYHAAGADQRILPDLDAVEHDCAHPDQAVIANAAAMHDDVVTDHAIAADHHGETWISMQRRIVLDLRAFAQFDPFVVAAQHGAEPDA